MIYSITTQDGAVLEISADYYERDADWVTLFVVDKPPQGGKLIREIAMFYKPLSLVCWQMVPA